MVLEKEEQKIENNASTAERIGDIKHLYWKKRSIKFGKEVENRAQQYRGKILERANTNY